MTFTRAITHQKYLAQSGRSTRSPVDIFNTLRVLTYEPIREQEITLECMNTEPSLLQQIWCPIVLNDPISIIALPDKQAFFATVD